MKAKTKISGLGKMMYRYVFSAAGIALFLLFLTIAAFILYAYNIKDDERIISRMDLDHITDGLQEDNGSFILNDEAQTLYQQWFVWAMLLDENGNVIWSDNLPQEFSNTYSAHDIAAFSGWYLHDYPVTVWQWEDENLLVLGSEQDSQFRYKVRISSEVFNGFFNGIPVLFLCYVLASFLLAIFFAYRMFRRVRPVTNAISELSEQKPIDLPTGGLLNDISVMLNQTSQELQNQRRLLDARDQSRTEWIAGISHDIRTPLSMVMGYAAQMEEDNRLPQEYREGAAVIRIQSQMIKELVSNLNLSSKLDYGWNQAQKIQVPLTPLLRKIVTQYLNSGLDAKYSLSLEISDTASNVFIQGDENLLNRMLQNLINNSLLHNPKGCSVVVSLSFEDQCARLCIADDGIGVKPAAPSKKNNGDSPVPPEHGIGLTIVAKIAKVHNGSFSVEINHPRGLRAVILLPAND